MQRTMSHRTSIMLLALAGTLGGTVGGVGVTRASAQESSAQAVAPAWTDPEYAKIAGMLSGSWKSSKPVQVGAESFDVMMSVAPVALGDLKDCLYAEVARADAIDRPYRQAIWRFHKVQGKTRIQTLEFRRKAGELMSVVGMWAAPDAFPKLNMSDLVATLDIELATDGAGFKGATPHAYPTSVGGAVEMTSQISFNGTTFTSADRGLGSDGSVVWGPASGESYAFARVDNPVKVARLDGGLITLTYPSKTEGETFKPGDRITLHYIGSLLDGFIFDTSYERNEPYSYNYGTTLVKGWTMGLSDAQKGLKRRLIIPSAMAYGERGRISAKIPTNATLVFAIDVLNMVSVPPLAPVVTPVAPAEVKPAETKPTETKPTEVKPTETKPQ
jgi:hypothetical protein